MRILVTGGKGFMGSALVDELINLGFEVGVFDSELSFIDNPKYFKAALEHRRKIYKNIPSYTKNGDIRKIDDVQKVFDEFQPEVVVHLAGFPMTKPPPKYEHLIIPINLSGSLNVLDVFENSPYAKKIMYTSSSMSYGNFTRTPQPEDVILNPISTYGGTKAAGEYFVKLSKKEWVIVRPTSVYGYTDATNRVTQVLLDGAILGKPAWVFKGEKLDFSYIKDVVSGLVKCIESPNALYQTFNISYGGQRLVSDFAEILKSYFPNFTYEIRNPTTKKASRGTLDITKARKLLRFEPKYSIEKGIEEILKLMKEYDWVKDAY